MEKEDLTKYGFREDFDWNTRLDLKTKVNGYLVSTVDLGLDHNFGVGEPLYYETMVFELDEDEYIKTFEDLYMERYATEEQAKEGHKRIVEMIRKGTEKES